MAKASEATRVEQGAFARCPIEFDTLNGAKCAASFRPIDGDLEAEVLRAAAAFAKENGVPDAKPGHVIYELGYEVATLVVAMVDPDVAGSDEPFWDGGAKQLRKALDRDRIAWLFEKHSHFQDTVSPRKHTLTRDEYFVRVWEIANAGVDDTSPFEDLRPGLQRSCMRFMARQLASFWTLKLPDSSSSGTPESP